MALDAAALAALKEDIKIAFPGDQTGTVLDGIAEALAAAIDTFVKKAKVTVDTTTGVGEPPAMGLS